jgi:archaellum component FlaC
MIRFSKQNLINELTNQILKMENIWGFVSTNGTNQIKDKSDFDRVLAYGEYIALLGIYESVENNTFLNL